MGKQKSPTNTKKRNVQVTKLIGSMARFAQFVLRFPQICLIFLIIVIARPINHYTHLFTNAVQLITTTTVICLIASFIIDFLTRSLMFSRSSSRFAKRLVFIKSVSIIAACLVISSLSMSNTLTSIIRSSFSLQFFEALKSNDPLTMDQVHRFQQEYKCCGVPMPPDIEWKEATLPMGNPWTSWYYTLILDENFIDQARRLFSLPWSCCRDTKLCEHGAVERLTVKQNGTNWDAVIRDVQYVDMILEWTRIDKSMETLYSIGCDRVIEQLVADNRFVIGAVFGFNGIIAIIQIPIAYLANRQIESTG